MKTWRERPRQPYATIGVAFRVPRCSQHAGWLRRDGYAVLNGVLTIYRRGCALRTRVPATVPDGLGFGTGLPQIAPGDLPDEILVWNEVLPHP
ncbi:MAG TPA: hypothetical protein VIY29_29230 [Ktedonobacteraceae bacterium]